MVEVKNLTKFYGSIKAVDDISFTVETGEVLGFLGPNGAGKSTTMNMIRGYLSSTSGTVTIDGCEILDDPIHAKSKIGYLPENHKFPNYLTGEQVLYFFGKLSGLTGTEVKKRADEYLGLMDMQKWRKTKIKKYSKKLRCK